MGWIRRTLRLPAVAAVAGILGGLPATGAGGGAVEELDRWLAGTRDLECRFEQRLVSSALGGDARESGVLRLERPGRLRWDYREPEPKIVLVDGDRTVLYLVEDRQWIRGRLSEEQGVLPLLLAGRGSVADLFVASEAAGDGRDGRPRVRLVRKGASEGFEEIVLTLRPGDHAIERAEVLDGAGNRVEYRFSGLKRNRGIDPSVFAIEPPPGVEILGEP